MDSNSRLLVLDAALCACEGVPLPDSVREHMNGIQIFLDNNLLIDLDHKEFVAAQVYSVEEFAKHPEYYS